MHASSFLAIAAATLATAAPVAQQGDPILGVTGEFHVTNFDYGCVGGCNYYFDVEVTGKFPYHPPVNPPVHCEGGWPFYRPGRDEPPVTDYVECEKPNETQSIYAYIDRETSILYLKYVDSVPMENAAYMYFGNQTVYTSSGTLAALQKPDFVVPETSFAAVA